MATSSRPYRNLAGAVLLVLAILTKQTAAIFLVTAVLGLAVSRDWRNALSLAGATLVLLSACIAAVAWWREPYFLPSLLGDAGTPWSFDDWKHQAQRFLFVMPDLLVVPALGLGIWTLLKPRQPNFTALVAGILIVSAVTVAKRGADVNYFLNLRIGEALAIGAFWQAGRQLEPRWFRRISTPIALFVLFWLVPALAHSFGQVHVASVLRRLQRSSVGQKAVHSNDMARRLAQDPKLHILTDSSLVDVCQGERTAFGDPFLFRLQVETGAIKPEKMIERVETCDYATIITKNDLFAKSYERHDSGLPMVLVEPARRRYALTLVLGGLYYYTPRQDVKPR